MNGKSKKTSKNRKLDEESTRKTNIHIDHLRSSNVNLVGGDQITYGSNTSITQGFELIYQAIGRIPDGQVKTSAQQAVKDLESEARKGNQVDEGKVKSSLAKLAKIAPDIFEVALKTLLNPIEGVSHLFRKIIERASQGSL